jgi:CheY-like chemotaxis protein
VGDYVRLSVTDTGVGMTAEVRERAFEPYFTTKELGKGAGLGLAQVYGFAKQSGGSVRIDSPAGRGTRVTLCLPRSTKAAAGDQRLPMDTHVKGTPPYEAGHVLLVEDNEEVSALVSEMLDQLGYRVTHAASAAAALGALANGRMVDIVFSDSMMPGGLNGVELAREIRARRAEMPVLLTSGYADAVEQAAEVAGVNILPKPYRIDQLSAALHAARQAVGG